MDELKAKVAEVKEEWNQTTFAFTEYTSEVLKRANQFINTNVEYTSSLDDASRLLLAELSEVVTKCKSIRSTIENRSNLAAESHLSSVTATSLSEVLREVNPSIFDDFDTLSDEDTTYHQTRPKELQLQATNFSGDDHLGNLPVDKIALEIDSPVSLRQTPEEDHPPRYSDLPVTPGYPTGAFNLSVGRDLHNIFSVKLNHKSPLKVDVRTRLDNVISVFFPSDGFNREDVSFKPSCNGVYAINVELCQHGNGEMDVWLCRRGHVSYVGKTKGHMLETSVLKVKMLSVGQDNWVEVRALKGRPSVYWCNFSGFLIAKTATTGAALDTML